MKIRKQAINSFLGLMTQYDPSQIPLGGAIALQNVAMLEEGRLRKIPGITVLSDAPVDVTVQMPLLFFAESLAGSNYSIAVGFNIAGNAIIVNLTTDAAQTGPALLGSFGSIWTNTFYNQKHIVAGGDNHPQEINAAGTHIDLVGTNVPHGNLVQSFQDRIYFADIATEEGIVRYSDVLTFDFQASSVVNTKELPGKTTLLAILSASTDQNGVDTYLVISKRNAIWIWNEITKDIISQNIGTESPHTWANTQVGPMFLGKDGNRNSVFYIPGGVAAEPKDIGRALHGLLNSVSSSLVNPQLACAVEDQGFYKLTFAYTGHTTNNHCEVWLDLVRMAKTGEVVWYGPHYRGDIDAMARTTSSLEMVRRGAAGANVWFQENTDTTQNFTDMDGEVLNSFLDLPLNTEPLDEEKIFEVMELQLAKEANKPSNEVIVEIMAEGTSQGNTSQTIYDGLVPSGLTRILIPLYPAGTTGFAARDARVRLTHSVDLRFDILGATIQYLYNEEPTGRVKSRIS